MSLLQPMPVNVGVAMPLPASSLLCRALCAACRGLPTWLLKLSSPIHFAWWSSHIMTCGASGQGQHM